LAVGPTARITGPPGIIILRKKKTLVGGPVNQLVGHGTLAASSYISSIFKLLNHNHRHHKGNLGNIYIRAKLLYPFSHTALEHFKK